jgi:hypothetical protein
MPFPEPPVRLAPEPARRPLLSGSPPLPASGARPKMGQGGRKPTGAGPRTVMEIGAPLGGGQVPEVSEHKNFLGSEAGRPKAWGRERGWPRWVLRPRFRPKGSPLLGDGSEFSGGHRRTGRPLPLPQRTEAPGLPWGLDRAGVAWSWGSIRGETRPGEAVAAVPGGGKHRHISPLGSQASGFRQTGGTGLDAPGGKPPGAACGCGPALRPRGRRNP